MAEAALYDLLSWASPAWPIGAFAYSSGLEQAVETRDVIDRASTGGWIADLLAHGALWNDAVLFVHAHRAASEGDGERLRTVAALALASLTGHERRLEATAQGAAYRRIALDSAPAPALSLLDGMTDDELPHAIVAACHFAGHAIPARPALTAWLHGAVANLVSAAQRLIPLGQTDGQRVLRDLREALFATVDRALTVPDGDPFDAMGGACLAAEIACMAHETQHTRLFRT